MTKYNFKGEFESDWANVEHEQEFYLASVLDILPEGAKAQVTQDNFAVAVPELTEEHVDHWIAVTRYPDKNVFGTIEKIYEGSSEFRRIVVINGKAHELYPYEIAVLTPPVSVGIKEADEIPQADVTEAVERTAEDVIEAFLDLAIAEGDKVAFLGSVISREFASELLGEEITPEEFSIMGPSLSQAIQQLINATLLSSLRDVHTQVQKYLVK